MADDTTNQNADLMEDLPDQQLEDLQKTISDSDKTEQV